MKKNKVLGAIFAVLCICVVAIAAVATVVAKDNFAPDGEICQGIFVDDINLGGKSEKKATKLLKKYVKDIKKTKVTVTVGDKSVETNYKKLGFTLKNGVDSYVDKALSVGKTGNLIKRYKEMKDVKEQNLVYELKYEFDEDTVKDFVEKNCSVFDQKAKNSKLKRVDGVFTATKSRKGTKVDVDETVTKILTNLKEQKKGEAVQIAAVVVEDEPVYTQEMVMQCDTQIGSFSTSYGTSTEDRANNVETAAGYINGTTIYPGETFSTSKTIKDRTEANGYKAAGEYNQGKLVEGIGGGVCQVSTTLYNAVLRAELEVVERSPHSMVVGYVDVSQDAAIAGDYMDFKFKNNTDAPVYIEAITANRTLSFHIYGHETRDAGRTIEFESEIIDTIEPGADVVTYDASQPTSYSEVTQEAHIGYNAKLWKIIYENGVQVDKIQVNSSHYDAEPRYITKGKKKDSKDDKKDSKDDKKNKNSKNKDKDEEEEDKKSSDKESGEDAKKEETAEPTATPSVEKETE